VANGREKKKMRSLPISRLDGAEGKRRGILLSELGLHRRERDVNASVVHCIRKKKKPACHGQPQGREKEKRPECTNHAPGQEGGFHCTRGGSKKGGRGKEKRIFIPTTCRSGGEKGGNKFNARRVLIT